MTHREGTYPAGALEYALLKSPQRLGHQAIVDEYSVPLRIAVPGCTPSSGTTQSTVKSHKGPLISLQARFTQVLL